MKAGRRKLNRRITMIRSNKRGRPRKVESVSKENEITALLDQIERLQIKIKNYEHQEIGWRAVVSYLESKIDGNSKF